MFARDENPELSAASEDEVAVESLVAGRQKRATAGNRMTTLLAREEEDDDLKLLFAENMEEEDVEFDGDAEDPASDVEFESSSDDEDRGPAAVPNDLEGEKELEKQAREERRKKRKAQEVFKRRPAPKAKSTNMDASGSTMQTLRQRKKSERVSWLPTPDEGPVRASSRKQTVQNKQVVHQRMKESEKRRRHQIEVMEAAAKRKEASKPNALTQEDRLAEAAKVEAKNAKSLNRWETAEKKRVEEQRAKLAALKNRTLEGPVLTWWSGPSKWVDGKCIGVGRKATEVTIAHKLSGNTRETRETKDSQMKDACNERADSQLQQSPQADIHMTDAPDLSTGPEGKNQIQPAIPWAVSQDVTTPNSAPILGQTAPQQQQLHASTLDLHTGSAELSQSKYPAIIPTLPKLVTEILSRNLVTLDANALKLPELQNHILLRTKKSSSRSTSKSIGYMHTSHISADTIQRAT